MNDLIFGQIVFIRHNENFSEAKTWCESESGPEGSVWYCTYIYPVNETSELRSFFKFADKDLAFRFKLIGF